MSEQANKKVSNFIRAIVEEDLATGKHTKIATRFPPEPNGYLHIGHAKAMCIDFGIANDYGGTCNLRFDDTNPVKEDVEFTEAIMEDIRWLGFEWANLHHTSDYFETLYEYAVHMIKNGTAYVDSSSPEEIREMRGTLTEPGRESPYRSRSIEENLDLFERMRKGEFPDGAHVLRAKIDMASPNINMRDPTLYRIRHVAHHRTDNAWCIYPMYDYSHPISDALEGITHSLCSLEYEDHRPLYDWVLENTPVPSRPRQIEFARLKLNYTVLSKRYLKQLVDEGLVDGWDDPRMPTLRGYRRRGYTPESIRNFCDRIGVAKADSIVDIAMLEHAIREDLEEKAPRAMCVVDPIKVVLTNYPEDKVEILKAPNHPKKPELREREIPFGREIWIERDDYMDDPPKDYFRLGPGREVRLRNSYVIKCEEAVKDASGKLVELRCTVDHDTLGKNPVGRKVKGIIHWVSARHAVDCEVRLYDRLFKDPDPGAGGRDFRESLNPNSLEIRSEAKAEPSLAKAAPESRYQFERLGYFCRDPKFAAQGRLVFNRTVTLRDSWSK